MRTTPINLHTRRRRQASTDKVVEDLKDMVDQLIRENTRLKREVTRLETAGSKANSSGNTALNAIQRRLAKALAGTPAKAPARPKPVRRPITDPVVLQKKREALAKAREARAAKKAALS